MIEIRGKHNAAVCYTDDLESGAYAQIQAICDEEVFASSKIRIMPDVHAGRGCTIGTTMTIGNKVVPEMVGVDIGCGMRTLRIAQKKVDFEKLDVLVREKIPCGKKVRSVPHPLNREIDLTELCCAKQVNLERARLSIGTLGGGNHFIEFDQDAMGAVFLVIHSGSRHLGKEVAEFYEEQGRLASKGCAQYQIRQVIEKLRAEGRYQEIQRTVFALKKDLREAESGNLMYVEGKLFEDYLHDMKIVQKFADLNRRAMSECILEGMGFTEVECFTTMHNYIDTDEMILRKGAVSAKTGEKLIIPINMRDGCLVGIGRGNKEWNCSAPHGAGRLLSRSAAFQRLSMEDYKAQMEGIFSTCVTPETLDESPMAYKSIEKIAEQIFPTVEIVDRLKPIYNFKAVK